MNDDLLSRLRDIGWRNWDPIGLLGAGEPWEGEPFTDEYDDYLLKIEADLRAGGSLEQAVEYLLCIEREHMALGAYPGQESRAEATAEAIKRFLETST